MQEQNVVLKTSCLQLSVQLSRGKRVVKGHFVDYESSTYVCQRELCEDEVGDSSDRLHHRSVIYPKKTDPKPEDTSKKGGFKITIPYGKKYNKNWLLNSIQEECGFYFKAIQFHYINNTAVFYVDNVDTARSLLQVSRKIQGYSYYKIVINATPSPLPSDRLCTPYTVDMNAIEICLRKRYDNVAESLDLRNLCNDPGLRSANILFSFNKSSYTERVVQIISENYPQVLSLDLSHNNLCNLISVFSLVSTTLQLQSLNLSHNKLCQEQDLDIIHNLELRELWLEGNPLHASMKNTSTYHRLIAHNFPNLKKLNGRIFQTFCFFDAEKPKSLPHLKGSFFVNEDIKTFLMSFLHKYYYLYDSDRRLGLLPLYHEDACCSFSLPSVPLSETSSEQDEEYLKESRNLLKVKKTAARLRLIRYNRLQVVGFLCNLPKTEHDLKSFTLDVSLQTTSLMCFTVEGIFKEVSEKCGNIFRHYRRTFIVVPSPDACAQILNDQLVLKNSCAGPQEASGLFTSSLTNTTSTGLTPDPSKLEVIHAFSARTAMKLDWAMKCLEDNNWNVKQAGEIFALLKERGAIPEEAFTGQDKV